MTLFLTLSVYKAFGEGNGTPLQYSRLENTMEEGACSSPWGR